MKDPSPAPIYAALYSGLCEVARSHGYALAIHGSVSRDLDLIAVPWIDNADSVIALIAGLAKRVGICSDSESIKIDGPEDKPCGRQAWKLQIDHGLSIDLSIIGHERQEKILEESNKFYLREDAPLTQFIRNFVAKDVSEATRKFHTEYQVNK